jgi:membrane protease YdiL (CAAX protease family)
MRVGIIGPSADSDACHLYRVRCARRFVGEDSFAIVCLNSGLAPPKLVYGNRKNTMDWKLFRRLLAACIVVTVLVLPYTIGMSPSLAKILTPAVLVAQVIQAGVVFAVSIFFGLRLSKKVGFGMPFFEGKQPIRKINTILGTSIGMGVLGGILIIVLSLPFPELSITFLKAEMSIDTWKRFLSAFYGGFAEEIVFRLFMMTLFVWISSKIAKTRDGHPTRPGIWISIVLSTVIFGLGHLGITSGLTAITPAVISRAVLLNGVSVIFCWLYWKKGLESAMIAHFSSDIVVHVITPIVAAFFL